MRNGYIPGLIVTMTLGALASASALAKPVPGAEVSLSAQARAMVANDQVVVDYRIEASGRHPDALRRQVNGESQAIDARLAKEVGVMQATTGRSIEPIEHYDQTARREVNDGWRVAQSAEITASHLAAVPHWLSAIETDGARIDGLHYRVSDATMAATKERLRLEAIHEFRQQAAMVAGALGVASFRIVSLTDNVEIPTPGPVRFMAVAMNAPAPTPALDSGDSTVRVTVSGQIELPAKIYAAKSQ